MQRKLQDNKNPPKRKWVSTKWPVSQPMSEPGP